MKNPLTCNGCVHNSQHPTPSQCSVCQDGNMFKSRQRIKYGDSSLDAAIHAVAAYGGASMILPEIKEVMFNGTATIVFWADDTKTVVKAVGETFDPEKGLAMAIAKKALGNKGNYFNKIKKWTTKRP